MLIPPLYLLLLAAGQSHRMEGQDKLLLPIGGKPLVQRVAEMALATGCPLHVALSPDHPARSVALRGLPLTQVMVPLAQEGSGRSIATGIESIPANAAVMVLLADQPDLTTADLNRVIEQWQMQPHRIHRGGTGIGKPGHPVIFPPALRPALLALGGDEGARHVIPLASETPIVVLLPAHHALTDIDTPEDWARWLEAANLPTYDTP